MPTPPELGRTPVLDGGRRETSPLVPRAVSGTRISSSAAELAGLSGPASAGTPQQGWGPLPSAFSPRPSLPLHLSITGREGGCPQGQAGQEAGVEGTLLWLPGDRGAGWGGRGVSGFGRVDTRVDCRGFCRRGHRWTGCREACPSADGDPCDTRGRTWGAVFTWPRDPQSWRPRRLWRPAGPLGPRPLRRDPSRRTCPWEAANQHQAPLPPETTSWVSGLGPGDRSDGAGVERQWTGWRVRGSVSHLVQS